MENLYTDILEHSNKYLGKTAIVSPAGQISYEEFLSLTDCFAEKLLSEGARSADRVGIGGLSKVDFLACSYACFKIGATAVPIPVQDAEKTANIIKDTNAAMVICEHVDLSSELTGILDMPPKILSTCLENFEAKRGGISNKNSEAFIISTSGTTSTYRKCVILSHSGISSTARFMNERMKTDSSVVEFVWAPLDHAFAFGRCHAVFVSGGTLYVGSENLNFLSLFDAIGKWGCNALSIVPSILASIIRIGHDRLQEVGRHIRWIQTGAMKFDVSYRKILLDVFPHAQVFLHYGLTEAMRCTFLDLRRYIHKIHTEGKPAEGVDIRIVDEKGEERPPEQDGEIWVRGRNLAIGYTDRDAWAARIANGWFKTGDIGRIDREGYLIFAGRHEEIINSNGILVHPNETERGLENVIKKNAYCVLGMPDPESIRDEIIVLCIEGDSDITLMDIQKEWKESEAHMIPRKLVFVPKLPRTRTGKVMRFELLQLLRNQQ